MSQTYTVQAGDTLLAIAIQQQVDFNQILALNPKYQPNPDLIQIGDIIRLPEPVTAETNQPISPIAPPEPKRPLCNTGSLDTPPQCEGKDIKNVLFVTEEQGKQYYCLDESSQQYLEEEASYTQQLIEGFQQVLEQAPDANSASEQDHLDHANKKKQWAIDAANAGAIAVEPPKGETQAASAPQDDNPKRVQAKLKELKQRRRFVSDYRPLFLKNESSVDDVKTRVLQSIEKEIAYYQQLTESTPKPQKPATSAVTLKNFTHSKTLTTKPARKHIVEVFSVRQNQFMYVRAEFLEREQTYWHKRTTNQTMLSKLRDGNVAEFKDAIIKDIKDGVTKKIENPEIELVLKEWKAEGGNSGEWKASHYILNEDGDTRFATNAEAQLLRWGASAAVKSTFEPSKGNVDIGIKAEAAYSLAEASVEFTSYLPYEAGFPISLSYTDANKQTMNHSFGRFRTNCTAKLSCFAGVMVSGSAGISNQNSQNNQQPAGHSILLAPSVGMGVNQATGQVGVKAEGFSGAQVGGELSGGLEWQHPDKETTLDFAELAKLKAEGNVAFGLGGGIDFQIELRGSELYLLCNGRIVWGAGGSGGFGATVNFEQIWELAQVVWEGLQYVDYRQLKSVNNDMYEYLMKSSYVAFASAMFKPTQTLINTIKVGRVEIEEYWNNRQSQQLEAEMLSERILNKQAWSDITPDKLQPETIGMMLDTLTETFSDSWEKDQERAICYLLGSSIYSWRKFEEVLVRMNPEGKKQSDDKALFDNLARLNAILDNNQQQEFNDWVHTLAQKDKLTKLTQVKGTTRPFTPYKDNQFDMKRNQINMQLASIGRPPKSSQYV
ncbi:LysM domain-containing protein [Vibrio sp. CK2-1]|uniref:LysM peptidoglycan-binding domain-containing protein n=1 Tax=Vibrio sp. CK2-1 TaxID=2912249 RepID=UPI001F46FC6A|nr:LysM domain-containing protein [Vibrio sp. CK2-1]MCF7352898.1 LysM peptidoglycan-binding domain-containing protein [Vibrio sp. CK2-1]